MLVTVRVRRVKKADSPKKKKTCFEQMCYVFMHKKFRMLNLVIFIS